MKCTCEKHSSTVFTVHNCICMLSDEELCAYERHVELAFDHMEDGDELKGLLELIEVLKIADHDMELRRTVSELGLKYWDNHSTCQ